MKKFLDKYVDSIIKKGKTFIIFDFLTILIVMQGSIFKWQYASWGLFIIMIAYVFQFIIFIPCFIEVILDLLKEVNLNKGKKKKE